MPDAAVEQFRPSVWGVTARRGVRIALFALLASYAVGATDSASRNFGRAIIWAIIGISLNILMGYSGQISLGHNAFVGVGAFTAAALTADRGIPMFLSIPAGALVGGVSSIILGAAALRIRGLYLALVTLAYGVVAERSIFQIEALGGGGAGQEAFAPAPFDDARAFTFLCIAMLAIVLLIDWRMMQSKFGRALLAMKSNEAVASSLGMNPVFHKLAAFILAGTLAGLAGGLLAFNSEVAVSTDFTFTEATLPFVIMVVIGGLGKRLGIVMGAFVVTYLSLILEKLGVRLSDGIVFGWHADFWRALGEQMAYAEIVITSLLLLLTITLFPGGLYQQAQPLLVWLRGHRFPGLHGGSA